MLIFGLINAYIESGSSSRKILKVLYNIDKKKSKYNELKFLEIKSNELGFELSGVPHAIIAELANGKTHGGILALCSKIFTNICMNDILICSYKI